MNKTKPIKKADFEIRTNPDGTLDEVVASNAKFVHLEQMSPNQWWLGLDTGGNQRITIWFTARGRAKVEAFAELE